MLEGYAIDAVIVDVDGVLIDTSGSYPRADIAAIDFIMRSRIPSREEIELDPSHILLFRKAGGFNSDLDMTQGLAAILTAQRTVWRRIPGRWLIWSN